VSFFNARQNEPTPACKKRPTPYFGDLRGGFAPFSHDHLWGGEPVTFRSWAKGERARFAVWATGR
jgi:hypothetical protein